MYVSIDVSKSIYLQKISIEQNKISPLLANRSLTTGTNSVNLFYFSYSIFDTAPNKQPFSHTRARYTIKQRNQYGTGAYEKFIYYTSLTTFFILLIFIGVYDHYGKTK